jgi:DNA-binding beta-propeller fold protein YncE
MTVLILYGCTSTEKKRDADVDVAQQAIEEVSRSEQEIAKSIFYPELPETPRLQFLVSITLEDDINVRKFPIDKNEHFITINRPYDIGAVMGKIYVSDRKFKKIIIVDLKEKNLRFIEGDYKSAGIWVTENDYKYVADFENKQIVVFDDNNKLARVYAYREQFDKPLDVTVYENKIYVSDINKHQIIVIDKDSGKTIQEIGGAGKEEGKLYKPSHVIVDKQGNLYVNDFFNFRIQKLAPDGTFIKKFGYAGDTLGALARPKGIDLDREGHLYVVDAAFENVQIFDDETTDLLLFFGGFGIDGGQMYLPSPVYVDYSNVEYFRPYADKDFNLKYLVYVGNTLGPLTLNVSGFGEWKGTPPSDVKQTEVIETP